MWNGLTTCPKCFCYETQRNAVNVAALSFVYAILAKPSQVAVEGTVFLRHKEDVLQSERSPGGGGGALPTVTMIDFLKMVPALSLAWTVSR